MKAGFVAIVLLTAFAVGRTARAVCEEPSLLTGDWQLTTFDGVTTNDVALERSSRAWALRLLTSPKPGGRQKRTWSMTHRLPSFDQGDVFKLEFEGRCQNPAGMPAYLFCATTGGPGMQRPVKRQLRKLSTEWKRHEVLLSMADVLPTCVLELLWEGAWKAGDGIAIRNIRLVPVAQPMTLDVLRPRNMRLLPETTNRVVGGCACFPSRFQGGAWGIDLVACDGGSVVRTISGTISGWRLDWRLETAGVADGCYEIRLAVTLPTGVREPEKRRPLFIGRPPSGSFAVRKGRVERDGKPFFPIILDHCAQWNIDFVNKTGKDIGSEHLTAESAYRDIAAHGFNAIHGSVDDPVKFARAAKPFGLMVIPHLRGQKPEVDNIVGWYGKDEPDVDTDRQKGRDYYAFAKYGVRQDVVYSAMYHPDALGYNLTEGAYCDVFMYDEYVIRTARSDFRNLSARLAETAKIARGMEDVVFGFAPQAFVYFGLEPTAAQLRAETYLAIAHGARALDYYAYVENWEQDFTSKRENGMPTATGQSRNPKRRHWWLKESDLWDEIGSLNGEFAGLQDYIFSDDSDETIRSVGADVFLSVRYVGGHARMVAVNLTPDPVVVPISSVRRRMFRAVFNGGGLHLEAGETPVSFAPYEVKVLEEVAAEVMRR